MRGHSKDTLIFILIAAMLMFVVDYLLFGGKEAYKTINTPPDPAPVVQIDRPPPIMIEEEPDFEEFDFFNEDWDWEEEATVPPQPEISETLEPAFEDSAPLTPPLVMGRPKIAIIIDDVGMNLPWSRAALDLPAPITLAILPYAEQAGEFARLAGERGHEILIHTPMEALDAPVSLGGMGLTTDMDQTALYTMMDIITARLDGYIGINNHMGSKFTSDRAAMEKLMPYLKERGLIFVDSKTIASSVAAAVAGEQGVPYAVRDVFLDHEETPQFVAAALQRLERTARKKGYAIAIGHPKDATITGLSAWLPGIKQKGFDLVPVSALVTGVAPISRAPEPAPDLPPPEPLLLYSPSPEIRY